MCGRLSLTSPNHRAAAELVAGLVPGFEVDGVARWLEDSGYTARYNVAPGQDHWVVCGREGRPILARANWGLAGVKGKRVINARAETIGERPMFQGAFAGGRCLVVADGFFEWERGSGRQPWWFRDAAGRGLLLAAVLVADRFAVITVPANEDVSRLHDRMPAIIDPSDTTKWLFEPAANARPLLTSLRAGALRATGVSRRVNSVEHDDPACVEVVSVEVSCPS